MSIRADIRAALLAAFGPIHRPNKLMDEKLAAIKSATKEAKERAERGAPDGMLVHEAAHKIAKDMGRK